MRQRKMEEITQSSNQERENQTPDHRKITQFIADFTTSLQPDLKKKTMKRNKRRNIFKGKSILCNS